MKKVEEMNKIEKIAYKNIKACIDYEVGGWYNCVVDDCIEYIPSTKEEAEKIIYNEVMNNKYAPGYCGYNKAPKEMRFAGEKFIKEYIKLLFDKDDDIEIIGEKMSW